MYSGNLASLYKNTGNYQKAEVLYLESKKISEKIFGKEHPDYAATRELMTSFYKNWFTGMEIRAAFKKAQNQLKTKYANVEGAAFAWAAFVLMR